MIAVMSRLNKNHEISKTRISFLRNLAWIQAWTFTASVHHRRTESLTTKRLCFWFASEPKRTDVIWSGSVVAGCFRALRINFFESIFKEITDKRCMNSRICSLRTTRTTHLYLWCSNCSPPVYTGRTSVLKWSFHFILRVNIFQTHLGP